MAGPLSNLTNPNIITAAGATVDNVSWTNDWSGVVNYINASLTASFNQFQNKGDILCYDGTNIQVISTTGVTDGWLLSKDSGASLGLSWVAPGGLPWTTAGDTLYYNSGAGQRLPTAGASNGWTLQLAGSPLLPVWAAPGGLPVGTIVLWSGAINTVPAGWGVCDGVSNITGSGVNLQGLFVAGAGGQSPPATGGMGLISPLTLAGNISSGAGVGASYTVSVTGISIKPGTTTAKTVGQSGNTSSVVVTPRYMALCYIELLP